MLRARALVAGVLVSAFLVPAAAGVAQESSTTTSSTTPTTTTIPKPDPDEFAALANQVSQNQVMLVQLTTQVDQTTQRLAELATQIATTQQKLDATRAEAERLREIVRSRAA